MRSAYIVIPKTVTPGFSFGSAGEGCFRICAFNSRSNMEEVCRRLKPLVA